jgi:hypothetical protein
MWLPFSRSVIPILERNNLSLTTPAYQKFFSTLILSVLDRYLGPEPAKLANWSVPGLSCNCGDCQRVTAFLAHPTQMSGKFPMDKERRHHTQQTRWRSRRLYAPVGAEHEFAYAGHHQANSTSGVKATEVAEKFGPGRRAAQPVQSGVSCDTAWSECREG